MRIIPPRILSLLLLIAILAQACAPGLIPAPPIPTTPAPSQIPQATPPAGVTLPPAIIETIPPSGSALSPGTTLFIYFNQAMERASVEQALSLSPAIEGLWNWMDDSILTFTPTQALPPATDLRMVLAASAKASNGLPLTTEQTLTFRAPQALRATQFLPAAAARDISPTSAIAISFNQPVVALGADATSLPAAFSLQPTAAGRGEWLNTSTYVFYPAPALSGGQEYTARVNPQLTSLARSALDPASPTSWSFKTSNPRIVNLEPLAEGGLELYPAFQITFNQPMDKASVQSALGLNGPSGRVDGTTTWNDNQTQLTFKPAGLLQRNASYTLQLDSRAQSLGGAPLEQGLLLGYTTYPDFDIRNVKTSENSYNLLEITFTSPPEAYSREELLAFFQVSPRVGDLYVYQEGLRLYLSGSLEADTNYTISVSGDLADRWGQKLGQDSALSSKTPPARPEIINNFQNVLFTRPDEAALDVQIVGLTQLNIDVAPIDMEKYFMLFGRNGYQFQQSYTPANLTRQTFNTDYSGSIRPYRAQLAARLEPGIYYTRITSTQFNTTRTSPQAILVSDVNLILKHNASEALVWAIDLRSMQPVGDAPVSIYDENGTLIASGFTDAQGLWRGNFPERTSPYESLTAVLVQPGNPYFGMASSDWDEGVEPYQFNINNGGTKAESSTYLYSDRPIYRPGDTVYFRGIVRQKFDGRYTPLGLNTVNVSSTDDSGAEFFAADLPISTLGTFDGQMTLPANLAPGSYNLNLRQNDEAGLQSTSLFFTVADYRTPELELSLKLGPEPLISGQTLKANAQVNYYFGAPAANVPVTWRLYRENAYFSLPNGYQTGLFNAEDYGYRRLGGMYGDMVEEGQGITDANGTLQIALKPRKAEEMERLTLEITASESGGFTVSTRASLNVHPEMHYVGIRPGQWFGRINTPLTFQVGTFTVDKLPLSGKNMTITFNKVGWREENIGLYPHLIPTLTPIETRTQMSLGASTPALTFTPIEAGTYLLEVSSGAARTQVFFWVGGSQQAAWPKLPFDRLELTANQQNYKPGDTATVFVPSPFDVAAPALVTVELGTVRSAQMVSIPAGGGEINLPITEAEAPNVYLSVTLLGANTAFRQGYINLPVDTSALELTLELSAEPQKPQPGQPISLNLRVSDSKNKPVQGQFSLAVVDLAVLALADPNSEDIVPFFYGNQPLGVRTGLTNAIYTRRFVPTPGGMGGGGGSDILTLRDNFRDTAYWNANIQTDANGRAQVTFTLPENLTTWQVEARGLTQDTRVGQNKMKVVVTKPLLIRPVTPRFMVSGDRVQLAAQLNNTTKDEIQAQVGLQTNGFTLLDPASATQTITIPANGRARVTWWGTAGTESNARLVFTVAGGGLSDSATPAEGDIPILPYLAPQTFATSGLLASPNNNIQELISLPRSFVPQGGELRVELSPSLAGVILANLETLPVPERNSNIETLLSYLLPHVNAYEALQTAGIADTGLEKRLSDNVMWIAGAVLQKQNSDGGWGWADTTKSDTYLSAYALLGLTRASSIYSPLRKLVVFENGISRAREYLKAAQPALPDGLAATENWQFDRSVFIRYALSAAGEPGILPALQALLPARERLDPWAIALLADSLAAAGDETSARDLFALLESGAQRVATGAYWNSTRTDWRNPGTPLFTTAVATYALARRDPASPLVADATRYLASQQRTQAAGASYENAWVLMALTEVMRGTGELQANFTYSATLNGTKIIDGQASSPQNLKAVNAVIPLSGMYLNSPNALQIMRAEGAGRLYYRATLLAQRPVESAPALNQGLSLSREYLACAPECQPIASWKMSANPAARIKVRLTVSLPNDVYYFNVEDYIPAGSEILDTSLKTSQQGEPATEINLYDPANPFAAGWGWWYFGAPRISRNRIHWQADYLPAGTYSLDYTIIPSLAGEYRIIPAHAWLAFFPEVQGTTAGALFTINE